MNFSYFVRAMALCLIGMPALGAEGQIAESVAAATPYSSTPTEASIGLGTSSLGLNIDSPKSYIQFDANNLSYYSVGINIRDVGVSLRLPNPDSSAQSRVQSTVTDYQIGFPLTSHLRGYLFYQDYKGYYAEKTSKASGYNANTIAAKPNLRSLQQGAQISYSTNPHYALTMSESSSWKQESDAGATIFSLGYSQFSLIGDVFSEETAEYQQKRLRRLDVGVLALRVGRGHNWMWQHWFVGSQVAVGASFSQIESHYEDTSESASDVGPAGCAGLSGGYQWTKNKLGLFARALSWQTKIGDSKVLTSHTIISGIYWSSLF